MTQHIHIDTYHSRVKGLRDFCFGGTVKVFKANPDGTNGDILRMETPAGKILKRGKVHIRAN